MSKWQEITVKTTEEAQEAVTNLFYEMGAAGVVIEDPKVLARYIAEGRWDAYELPADLTDANHVVIKGYLPMDDLLQERLNKFSRALENLGQFFHQYSAEVSLAEISEEDWANSWKNYYKPEKVGEKIVIVPSWEHYEPQEGDVIIRLDPGMAFGTGNHPTTALSLRFMEKYLEPHSKVIDVGTGSGVLAIAAAKLGADHVLALDIDPMAVKIAQQNIAENGVGDKVEARYNDLLAGIKEKAHFIVANIVADVILALTPQAEERLYPGGYYVVSGIIQERWPEVQEALERAGLTIVEKRQEGQWVAAIGKKAASR